MGRNVLKYGYLKNIFLLKNWELMPAETLAWNPGAADFYSVRTG